MLNIVLYFLVYRSLIHEHTLGVVVFAVVLCTVIMFGLWIVFIRKTNNSSTALINNVDNKSLNSTNSKDSGTGESTKRSQELLYNECNILIFKNKINENIENCF